MLMTKKSELTMKRNILVDSNQFEIELVDSIDQIFDSWSSIIPDHQLFMQSDYLKLLEECPPDGMRFRYVFVRKQEEIVGALYFQIVHYNAFKSLNLDNDKARKRNSWSGNIIHSSKEYVAKSLDFDGLILGNLLTTGQNAFYFIPEFELKEQIAITDECLHQVRSMLIESGIRAKMAFIKDFPDDYFGEKYLQKSKCEEYYRLDAYPNMVLNLDPAWKSFDDYLNAFKSKYRVSIRKALNKITPVTKRLLRPYELPEYGDRMNALYRNISDSASFNLFFLHADYFPKLGQDLQEAVSIYGYFIDGEMIAFYTVLHNERELDAHFLGYDLELNKQMQVYKNMLLDMVREAIVHRQPKIIFSRTAMEIKSSIGAIDQDMSCYIQHRNKLQNVLSAKFFDWLKPENDWIIRKPFKETAE
jgi:hypothetical protein